MCQAKQSSLQCFSPALHNRTNLRTNTQGDNGAALERGSPPENKTLIPFKDAVIDAEDTMLVCVCVCVFMCLQRFFIGHNLH